MFDLSGVFGVERFRVWCQKVLPTVYDDSLSYMELLCKVLKVLEEYGNGSAEIAEQVVLLNGELEKVKEDIAQLTENGGKTDEQVGVIADAIVALGERMGAVERHVVSIAESVAGLNGMVGGKTAYLGEYVNMEDVPADAVIVGGNGTEEEPYNAFEAGGSKEHGGWVRVGSEVVPEDDFKKLEEVLGGERSVEKAVVADRIKTIDLSKYNDATSPIVFARALNGVVSTSYCIVLVYGSRYKTSSIYALKDAGNIVQLAGETGIDWFECVGQIINDEEPKDYTVYKCKKFRNEFPVITVLGYYGEWDFYDNNFDGSTFGSSCVTLKNVYLGRTYLSESNVDSIIGVGVALEGVSSQQLQNLKTFAVGETKLFNLKTFNTEENPNIYKSVTNLSYGFLSPGAYAVQCVVGDGSNLLYSGFILYDLTVDEWGGGSEGCCVLGGFINCMVQDHSTIILTLKVEDYNQLPEDLIDDPQIYFRRIF